MNTRNVEKSSTAAQQQQQQQYRYLVDSLRTRTWCDTRYDLVYYTSCQASANTHLCPRVLLFEVPPSVAEDALSIYFNSSSVW